jgi:hypothetical protein
MRFGWLSSGTLIGVGVAVGIATGGAGGFSLPATQAASPARPAPARDDAVVRTQASPQPESCGTSSTAPPCKKPAKPKAKKEKQRRISPCGPGLAPCPGSNTM